MDQFTQWDDDGMGAYTAWDDVPSGPAETRWDVLPAIIGRGFRVIWTSVARGVKWV